MTGYTLHVGDCLESLRAMPAGSVHTCVTSPPYFGLRDYGVSGQIGLEPTPDQFVAKLVEVFREVRRVLRDDGTLWLNLGDSYAANGIPGKSNLAKLGERYSGGGHKRDEVSKPRKSIPEGLKPKDLIGIPWRVAFALQADGWYLRQDIIWSKPNPMPESVRDRCTKAHEYIFLLSKSERYYFDADAIKEPSVRSGSAAGGNGRKDKAFGVAHGDVHRGSLEGVVAETRNRRSVWTVATRPYKGAHFATFPPELIEPCILAGAPAGGIVLDPFGGSGTTAGVAIKHGRQAVICELNPEYTHLIPARVASIVDAKAKKARKPKRPAVEQDNQQTLFPSAAEAA